jgi:hypothetical protein
MAAVGRVGVGAAARLQVRCSRAGDRKRSSQPRAGEGVDGTKAQQAAAHYCNFSPDTSRRASDPVRPIGRGATIRCAS